MDGHGYKYQDFNEIVRTIKNVIKDNNLDINFIQFPTIKSFGSNLVDVVQITLAIRITIDEGLKELKKAMNINANDNPATTEAKN